ncbi:hypothetical protein BJ085DRAFT_36107 [Dimargaris cristalligena]|uniref:Cyclin-like domain-containing protein n=1 Tax=Dimargaris cristalligena TaxID=215637 RepID=A0A4P9ZS48_9FUNG|nr:hypothetical protein BJ085DRAFT_36107 [Dimargaris cristalligena]|eukprot:RKP35611.1 hypothetical protein BJ085DRAFT_36107 [Dimargaris cristalligena]
MTAQLFKRKSAALDSSRPITGPHPSPKPNASTVGPRRRFREIPGAIESWVTQRMGFEPSRKSVPSKWFSTTERKSPIPTTSRLSGLRNGCSLASRTSYNLSLPTRPDPNRRGRLPTVLSIFKDSHHLEDDNNEGPSSKRLCTPVQDSFDDTALLDGDTVTGNALSEYIDLTTKIPENPVVILLSPPVLPDDDNEYTPAGGNGHPSPASGGDSLDLHGRSCHPSSPYSDASTDTLLNHSAWRSVHSTSPLPASPLAAHAEGDHDDSDGDHTLCVDAPNPLAEAFAATERDCFAHMQRVEADYTVDPHYLVNHPDLNVHMRPILVDWLLEVGADFHLHRATIHMAVNFLDRFLSSCRHVTRDILQCVATACLSIAIKLEEYTCPKLKELVDLAQGAFDLGQLKRAEHIVLKGIKWRLTPPTIQHWLPTFFHRASQRAPAVFHAPLPASTAHRPKPPTFNPAIHRQSYQPTLCPLLAHIPQLPSNWYFYASHIADVALHHTHSLRFSYSTLAAASFYLVLDRFAPDYLKDSFFEEVTGQTMASVQDCVTFLRTRAGPLVIDVPSTADPSRAKYRFGPNYQKYHKDAPYAYQNHHAGWLPAIQKGLRDSPQSSSSTSSASTSSSTASSSSSSSTSSSVAPCQPISV